MPQELESICTKAMAKHPADRYQTAEEFAQDLRGWLNSRPTKRKWNGWGLVAWITSAVILGGLLYGAIPSEDGLIRDGVLHFDGHTRIVTQVERTLPVTIEAWVKPDAYQDEQCQFILGSDIPGKYGLGLAICGSGLAAERVPGMVNTNAAVPPGRWSHVAVTFSESETRVYLNGKLVESAPGSTLAERTRFVVGNAGEKNLISFYRGDIRSLRISEGARYEEQFNPEPLEDDEATLLLLDSSAMENGSTLLGETGEVLGRVERY